MKRIILSVLLFCFMGSMASPTRSSVAARQSAIASEGAEVSIPYVTDGLVAMWDGIWNQEIGKHDLASPYWTDLLGGIDLLVTRGAWSPNGLSWDGSLSCIAIGTASVFLVDVLNSDQLTVEVLLTPLGYGANGYSLGGNNGARLYTVGGNDVISWARFNSSILSMIPYAHIGEVFSHSTIILGTTYTRKYINGVNVQNQGVTRSNCTNEIKIDFKGIFHSIRVYNRALSGEEVEYNHLVDRERFGF